MSWSISARAEGRAAALADFTAKVQADSHAPKDGRLESAAEKLVGLVPEVEGKAPNAVTLTTSGHIDERTGTSYASVNVGF